MTDPNERPKRIRLLEERIERRTSSSPGAENPYWRAEEPSPPPARGEGCAQRGGCCSSSPGWFGPGELEKAAALLEMEPDEFVRTYAVIDGIEVDGEQVEVFAPIKIGRDGAPLIAPGTRADRVYRMFRSPCVFFEDGGCRIYPERPIECRAYLCSNDEEENLGHEAIARMWRDAAQSDE